MELVTKKGYKQTEVGLIPEDWEIINLSNITSLITDGAHLSPPTSISGFPIATVENITSGRLNIESCRIISTEDYNHLVRNNCQPVRGDVLLSKDGTIGITFTVKDNPKVVLLSSIALIRPNPDLLLGEYLSYTFKSDWFYIFLSRVKGGSALKRIVLRDLNKFVLPLPPTLAEQKAIATALSDVDALIDSLDQLIQKKEAIKQGAMQELLTGKTRLEGFAGSGRFKQTEVGLIPEEWEVKEFSEIGQSIIGLTYSPRDVHSSGKLVHRSSNIQSNQLAYDDNVYVSCSVPEKLVLKENDILICVRNGSRNLIGKAAIIKGRSIGETFGAFMSVFRTNGYAPFVYQCFISNIIQSQISASLGATINQITNKTLNSFLISLPKSLFEQKAIAKVLSDMDTEIDHLQNKKAKYQRIKQGMMQELLTGKTRLI